MMKARLPLISSILATIDLVLEGVSFATLNRLLQSLKLDNCKEYITEQFGLKKVAILENWLHAISNLRNCCAHHSRTWNRRFMVSVLCHITLFIRSWIELQSDNYAQTNCLLRFLGMLGMSIIYRVQVPNAA